MQPSDSQLTGEAQQIIIDPSTGLPQNVMIIQQESAAPKVIGILVIIWGSIMSVLTLIALLGVSLITDPDSKIYSAEVADSPTMFYALLILSLACFVGQIVGGAFTVQRKRLGIHIVWLSILVSLVGDVAMEMSYPDYIASQAGAMSTSVNLALSSVCSLVCGLMAAIPLMVSGSGMDDSKLIG